MSKMKNPKKCLAKKIKKKYGHRKINVKMEMRALWSQTTFLGFLGPPKNVNFCQNKKLP
jgi:hypothetical protein